MFLMIVCICNNINCKSVRAAVEAGARCPVTVQKHHGSRFRCGKCTCSIGDIIAEEMDRTDGGAPLLAAE